MRFAPRAMNVATTGGTGSLELIGARKACDQLLSAAGDGGLVYYGIESQAADEWEEGLGIVHAGAPPTLQRVATIESSNADALVNFTTGTKLVFITSPSIVQAAAHLHKPPCRVAVTTNVNVASALAAGSSAGGVTLATGDRVFLVGQTDPIQNGPWLAPATGAATRPLDFYTGDTCRGSMVQILEGSHAGETYICTATAAAKIGTDGQTWVTAFTGWTGSTSITTLGTITTGVWNATAIAVAYGGTGATTAAGARANLGVTATGADTAYAFRSNNLSDLANASAARTNLGLAIGTNVQAFNASLAAIAAGTWAGASSITTLGTIATGVWNGTSVAVANGGTGATSAATARSNLGVTATGADTAYAFRANNLSDLANAGTARTNLGVTATGADTTYAFRANNLSDLANAGTARTNLGVTATGADTTYAFRANNLSDLASASTARTNLGLAIGTNVQAFNASLAAIAAGTWAGASSITTVGTITSGTWNGGAVPVANGGTGAISAASARSNLGLAIGTDVQAQSGNLAAVSAGSWSGASSIITLGTITTGVWNGTALDIAYGGTNATTVAGARTNLGGHGDRSGYGLRLPGEQPQRPRKRLDSPDESRPRDVGRCHPQNGHGIGADDGLGKRRARRDHGNGRRECRYPARERGDESLSNRLHWFGRLDRDAVLCLRRFCRRDAARPEPQSRDRHHGCADGGGELSRPRRRGDGPHAGRGAMRHLWRNDHADRAACGRQCGQSCDVDASPR